MDEIHEKSGMSLEALREATRERKHWRGYIMTVAKAPRVDGTR
jgi:hypothetical protein